MRDRGGGVRRDRRDDREAAGGHAVRCEGFIARRWRTGLTLALHVDRIERLDTES
jgi:hypothetical protein